MSDDPNGQPSHGAQGGKDEVSPACTVAIQEGGRFWSVRVGSRYRVMGAVIAHSGHWIMQEQLAAAIAVIRSFLGKGN